MSDVTFAEVDSVIQEIVSIRSEIEKQEAVLGELNKKLTELKQRAVGLLETLERDSYSSPFGLIYRSERVSVTTPKTWEDKEKFMEYLKSRGGDALLQSYITFNSRSLQSFVKAELEARQEMGDLNTDIPGIATPSVYVDLGFRKK